MMNVVFCHWADALRARRLAFAAERRPPASERPRSRHLWYCARGLAGARFLTCALSAGRVEPAQRFVLLRKGEL
jgi:hypothetical protein